MDQAPFTCWAWRFAVHRVVGDSVLFEEIAEQCRQLPADGHCSEDFLFQNLASGEDVCPGGLSHIIRRFYPDDLGAGSNIILISASVVRIIDIGEPFDHRRHGFQPMEIFSCE